MCPESRKPITAVVERDAPAIPYRPATAKRGATRGFAAIRARHVIAAVVLLGSGFYLTLYFDWAGIWAVLRRVHWLPLGLVILAVQLLYLYVRTLRWLVLIRTANPDARFRDLYLANAILVSFAIVTPAQLGEVLKVEALKRRRILTRTEALGLLVVERVLDLAVLVGLGLSSTVALSIDGPLPGRAQSIIAGLGAGAAVAAALVSVLLGRARRRALRKRLGLVGLSTRALVLAGGLSILSWLLIAFAWRILLTAIELPLDPAEALALLTWTTLGGVVSFVPGALGVAEVISAQMLERFGAVPLQAATGAVMLRLYSLAILAIGLFHLVYWWARPAHEFDRNER
jgi:glycosyltransferase 2 family protein